MQSGAADSFTANRTAIRSTWLQQRRAWEAQGVVCRFTVAHGPLARRGTPALAGSSNASGSPPSDEDSEAEARLAREAAAHGDLLFLPHDSASAAAHMLQVLDYTQRAFDADFVIKLDDSALVQLPQLLAALGEWRGGHVGAQPLLHCCRGSAHESLHVLARGSRPPPGCSSHTDSLQP